MARSGVNVLNKTAAQIISSALRRARIIPVRQPVSSIDFATGLEALNNFIAKLRSQGWHLWKSEEYVLFLDQGKTDYFLGPTGDHACLFDNFIQDSLAIAAAPSDTQLQISDTSRFTGSDDVLDFNPATSSSNWSVNNAAVSSDGTTLTITNSAINGYAQYQPIDTTTGTNYFFEVDVTENVGEVTLQVYSGISTTLITSQTVTSNGTQTIFFDATEASTILRIVNDNAAGSTAVTNFRLRQTDTGERIGFRVSGSLREWNIVTRVISSTIVQVKNVVANAGSVGTSVFAYKTLPPRPLKLRHYRSKDATATSEIPVNTWSREEYMRQTIKSSQGLPTQIYYQPELDNGRVYVWQTASDVNQIVLFTGDTPLEIFVENAENPDFPAEWFEMLSWGLASLIGPEYGVPPERQARLDAQAAIEKEDALDWDQEQGSLFVVPTDNGRMM